MCYKIRHLSAKSKHYLTTINIFPSVSPSSDEHELSSQRISTRLFIVIFITLFIALLLYISLITIPKTIIVKAPSFDRYSNLNSEDSLTLTCPCSKISINYAKFIHVEYTLHQVCSSIFVSELWINYLKNSVPKTIPVIDFRLTGISSFRALKIFCTLINSTIFNGLIDFYSNQHVSALLVTQQLLKSQIESSTDKFRLSMIDIFSLSFAKIRSTTHANGLYSVRGAGLSMLIQSNNTLNDARNYIRSNTQNYIPDMMLISSDSCNCHFSSTCIFPFSIYGNYSGSPSLFDVPDFYFGCYAIESLLQSKLKCFYNQSCIDELTHYMSSSISMNITALNASLSRRYSVNSTIQELVEDLMIEEWNVSVMYKTYYNECQPIQCTYKVETRNNFIYILTILFGIGGILATVLKLIVPRLVKFARKKRRWQQQAPGKIKSKTKVESTDVTSRTKNRLIDNH